MVPLRGITQSGGSGKGQLLFSFLLDDYLVPDIVFNQ